jgi:hypothetical protein
MKASRAFYANPGFKNSLHLTPWYFCEIWLTTLSYPRASDLFHLGSSTKTCGCISVRSNTCYNYRPSHPQLRSKVQIMKFVIKMFPFLRFSSLHQNICLCKGMSTEVKILYNPNLTNLMFSDRASQYNLVSFTNLMHNSFSIIIHYIKFFYMFPASPCSSSGGLIV